MYTHFKIPFLNLENYTLNVDIVKTIPEEIARSFQVIALERWGNILTVGMVDPEDEKSKRILETSIKCKVITFFDYGDGTTASRCEKVVELAQNPVDVIGELGLAYYMN